VVLGSDHHTTFCQRRSAAQCGQYPLACVSCAVVLRPQPP
jgi:hypothetical protein